MVQALRRHREMDDTPILMVTARTDETFRVDMLKEGVQGYFIKPFSAGELEARVDGIIAEKKSRQALRESQAALRRATDKANRRAREAEARERILSANRYCASRRTGNWCM